MKQDFFDLAQDMLCIALPEGRFSMVNEAWTRELGWSAEELCSRPYAEFVHPDDRERTVVENHELGAGRPTYNFRNRYRHKDGGYHWFDWRAQLRVESGEIYASARNVTREVLLHQKLVAREELLTGMVAQHLGAREDEHRRIANELHDSALQHSVAALMFLDMVPAAEPAVHELVDLVRAEVRRGFDATRLVMQGLDPLDLGEHTLEAAIRAIASEMEDRSGVAVGVSIQPVDSVDDHVAVALCRMVREGLVNAVKHAGACTLSVSVGADDLRVWAAVHDDGRGMIAARETTGDRGGPGLGLGLGLAFLQERAASLGGTLELISSTSGTEIRMAIPRDAPGRRAQPGISAPTIQALDDLAG